MSVNRLARCKAIEAHDQLGPWVAALGFGGIWKLYTWDELEAAGFTATLNGRHDWKKVVIYRYIGDAGVYIPPPGRTGPMAINSEFEVSPSVRNRPPTKQLKKAENYVPTPDRNNRRVAVEVGDNDMTEVLMGDMLTCIFEVDNLRDCRWDQKLTAGSYTNANGVEQPMIGRTEAQKQPRMFAWRIMGNSSSKSDLDAGIRRNTTPAVSDFMEFSKLALASKIGTDFEDAVQLFEKCMHHLQNVYCLKVWTDM